MNELINLGNGAMVKITMLKGEAGNSIVTITKTSTSGLVDTYTVTLTDGTQTTFQVTNGTSIDHIAKTDTQGAIDTYTIYLTDGSVGGTFEVKNATGVIDENFSSSSTNAIQTATVTNVISGVENGATASKSYNAGEYILKANKMYEVTATVAQDDTWTVGVNLEETNIGLELKQINTSLTASNGQPFRYDYQNGEYGYVTESGGADTFIPFKNWKLIYENKASSFSFDVSSYNPKNFIIKPRANKVIASNYGTVYQIVYTNGYVSISGNTATFVPPRINVQNSNGQTLVYGDLACDIYWLG